MRYYFFAVLIGLSQFIFLSCSQNKSGDSSKSTGDAKTGESTQAKAAHDTITTASGLKYYDLKVGTGPVPPQGQMVRVHYIGWLTDGTKFQSSRDVDSPIKFTVGTGMVIKGWDEGVGSMHQGGIRVLIIPPNLAYGDKGNGKIIPPNATLIFEIELLEFVDYSKPTTEG